MHSLAPGVPAVPLTSASRLSRGGERAQQLDDNSTSQLVSPVGVVGPGSRQISGGLLDSDGFTDVSLEASPAKSARESTQYGLARHRPAQTAYNVAPSTGAAARRPSPAIVTGEISTRPPADSGCLSVPNTAIPFLMMSIYGKILGIHLLGSEHIQYVAIGLVTCGRTTCLCWKQ